MKKRGIFTGIPLPDFCFGYTLFDSSTNEINPLTPAGISHGEAIFHARSAFHKSRKGFISQKKARS